ncbi:heme exporter protein B [Modestobacter sp. DSM 44400]|uniref:heme exporter protein CcmB n=1 Tax=Modestobacter sp. DSM 44400 TaxID=1550230 RepID=UPI00089C0599|nr:heme exporter protein CcmB [Modestobacter sp. DSM 44400]SDY66128.1 heme exporter protein B [Modestobacter sp. DSM 44400]
MLTAPRTSALRVTVLRQGWLLLRRELAIEKASRETLVTVAPFVGVLVLLGGLAFGPRPAVFAATAPGMVWFAVLVAAVPLAPTVAIAEAADDAWDLLRAVAAPGALLAGKLAAMWLRLLVGWGLATLLVATLFGVPATTAGLAGGVVATLGVAALTVLLGTLLPATTRRPALLAVLLLPASLPALVAGTQTATTGVPAAPWLALLAVFDLLTLTVTWAVFPTLLED